MCGAIVVLWFTEEHRGETPPSLRFCPKGVPVKSVTTCRALFFFEPSSPEPLPNNLRRSNQRGPHLPRAPFSISTARWLFPAQCLDICFPVCAVKLTDCQRVHGRHINAIGVDRPTIRMATRHVKCFHTARFAKEVPGRARIETIVGQVIFPRRDTKLRLCGKIMHKACHLADAAGTAFCFHIRRGIQRKRDGATMAATLMGNFIGHDTPPLHQSRAQPGTHHQILYI